MSIRFTEQEYADLMARRGKSGQAHDNTAVSIANVEHNPNHGPKAAAKGKEIYPRFCIRIHSHRRRLIDPDGLYSKAAVDGLTAGGILSDDNAYIVKEVSYTQSRALKGEPEETVIIVEEILELSR